MATMLRHVPTGDLYPLNENLARRDDMVEYIPPPEGGVESKPEIAADDEIVIAPVKPKSRAKSRAKPKAKAEKQPDPEPEVDDDDLGDLAAELDLFE